MITIFLGGKLLPPNILDRPCNVNINHHEKDLFEITIAAIISLVNRQFGATNVLKPYLVSVSVFFY